MDQLRAEALAHRLSGSPDEIVGSKGGIYHPELVKTPITEAVTLFDPFGAYSGPHVPMRWMDPLGELLDEAIAPHPGVRRFYWLSAPRNHGKSIMINAFILKHFATWPNKAIGLYTNKDPAALERSRQVRRACDKFGWHRRHDSDKQSEFEFPSGAIFKAGTVLNFTHGARFRTVIIDDPYPNAEKAKSASIREKVLESVENDIMPSIDPDGSLIIIHARQHPNDLIGHFKAEAAKKVFSFSETKASETPIIWKGCNLQALTVNRKGDEEALWPDRFPVPALKEIRNKNPLTFVTQYQGEPRTEEGTLFRFPETFDLDKFRKDAPNYSLAYGIDLAFSGRSSNRGDWSVIVKMVRVSQKESEVVNPETGKKFNKDLYFILDVIRKQKNAPDFTRLIKGEIVKERGRMLWHCAPGPEKGNSDFIRKLVPELGIEYAKVDKYAWATPMSEAWNDGRVLVPRRPERPDDARDDYSDGLDWVEDFVDELTIFTGDGSGNDDQVDAAASAFNLLQVKTASRSTQIPYHPSPRR